MSEFFRRLDERMIKERNARIFRDRPENLHDYQGCAKDAGLNSEVLPATPTPVFIEVGGVAITAPSDRVIVNIPKVATKPTDEAN